MLLTAALLFSKPVIAQLKKPNIIFIYVDDLSYGDLGCYGATAVKSPNVDKLAANDIRFTDGHCTASTCTPSRFSKLTGSYAFRNNAAILPGDAPLIIDTKHLTLPGMLKQEGYATAAIGKWHLGLGTGHPNWNDSISPGPNEIGFKYSFIIPATPERALTVFVENHHLVNYKSDDPIAVDYEHRIGDDPIEAFFGKYMAIVQSKGKTGEIKIAANSPGLLGASVSILAK